MGSPKGMRAHTHTLQSCMLALEEGGTSLNKSSYVSFRSGPLLCSIHRSIDPSCIDRSAGFNSLPLHAGRPLRQCQPAGHACINTPSHPTITSLICTNTYAPYSILVQKKMELKINHPAFITHAWSLIVIPCLHDCMFQIKTSRPTDPLPHRWITMICRAVRADGTASASH
jgi:hypothetical protein